MHQNMREMTLKAARKAGGVIPSRLYTCAGHAPALVRARGRWQGVMRHVQQKANGRQACLST